MHSPQLGPKRFCIDVDRGIRVTLGTIIIGGGTIVSDNYDRRVVPTHPPGHCCSAFADIALHSLVFSIQDCYKIRGRGEKTGAYEIS